MTPTGALDLHPDDARFAFALVRLRLDLHTIREIAKSFRLPEEEIRRRLELFANAIVDDVRASTTTPTAKD